MKLSTSILCLGVAGVSPAIQMLLNAGFEEGDLAPWVQTSDLGGSLSWEVTTDDAFGGTASARAAGNKELLQSLDKNPLGADVFEFSLWMKSAGEARAVVVYTDASRLEVALTGTGDWEFYDITAEIDPAKNVSAVGFWASANDVTTIDDVTLDAFPVPEPATLAALGLGALALRRKRSGSR